MTHPLLGVVRKNSNAVKAAVCGMIAAFAGRASSPRLPLFKSDALDLKHLYLRGMVVAIRKSILIYKMYRMNKSRSSKQSVIQSERIASRNSSMTSKIFVDYFAAKHSVQKK
jgi:hypothetical protein